MVEREKWERQQCQNLQRKFAQDNGGAGQKEKLQENTTEQENSATGGALDARGRMLW